MITLENVQGIFEFISVWGLKVVGGIAVLIVGMIAGRLTRKGVRLALSHARLDETLVSILGNLTYYMVLSMVAIAVLGAVGIQTASLITVLGAASLAIGLALQGSLSNFASGVMLFLFRPFRVSDYIEVGDHAGTVAEVGVFSTLLDTLDNIRIVIPNSYIAEHPIQNWSTNGIRRLDLEIEIAVDSDLPRAREAINEILSAEPQILDEPVPVVGVSEFGDTSAKLIVRPWCRHTEYWNLRFSIPERMKEAIERVGCTLPCPKRDIQVTRMHEAV
jgi:small conductance mechanosensitive channel